MISAYSIICNFKVIIKKAKIAGYTIFMQHFGCFLIKIHQSFERSAIEIDKRENIQDNFIHTLLIFTWKNSQELKLISNLCNKDYNS